MANEKITENFVRDKLRELKYQSKDSTVRIEEQQSTIARVKSLLANASKTGKGGRGAPEFIISNDLHQDFIIVFECKADPKKHKSKTGDRIVEYAVDGALHYAKALSKEYNVVAVAVSGSDESAMRISNFIYPKGAASPMELTNEAGKDVKEILGYTDYLRLSAYDPLVTRNRKSNLLAFARDLHELIWTKAKISEEDKPLLVSGTLIALMNKGFKASFMHTDPEELQDAWFEAISKEFGKVQMGKGKLPTALHPYANISTNPNLSKPDGKLAKDYPQGIFKEIIRCIHDNVLIYLEVHKDFDVVGQFYGEFLKYTAGDKKALGIVLTPHHITELFALLANVTPKDKVVDICAGTGGFLIASMQQMLKQAVTEEAQTDIKRNRLIGIENNPKMFTLGVSNMILRGDGKANMHQSSCFDPDVIEGIRKLQPTVGMVNPPYSQSKSDSALHELYFIKQMLDLLKEGGRGIAIVPMSCAISSNPAREELMKQHTLEAVMSMPGELFYPVGTVTCIMVWTAHQPHEESDKDTWFGYWKDDGFTKTKHMGRVDLDAKWEIKRDAWVKGFRNKSIVVGESVIRRVGPDDEWCAEAYMETDYSKLTQHDFESVVKNYAVFKLLGAVASNEADGEIHAD